MPAKIFGSNLAHEIAEIRRRLQLNEYHFERLRIAVLPKTNGGDRIIAIPTVRDRLVQRAVLQHLEQDSHFSGNSKIAYGFRKGRSLTEAHGKALELRNKYPWVIKADIIKFFDNIDRSIIRKKVENSIRTKAIQRIIHKCIDGELDQSNPKAMSIAIENGIVKGRGLRQGMPVSPMLSNLLLRDFDNYLISSGLNVVRYADDIAIFCNSEKECTSSLELIISGLDKLKLKIPELSDAGKTIILNPTDTLEFLGIDIKWVENSSYIISAPFKKLEKITARLSEISNVEYLIDNKTTMIRAISYMDAFLDGHSRSLQHVSDHAEFSHRLKDLKKKHVDLLLISIFGKKFVDNIPTNRRAILGLEAFP